MNSDVILEQFNKKTDLKQHPRKEEQVCKTRITSRAAILEYTPEIYNRTQMCQLCGTDTREETSSWSVPLLVIFLQVI